MGTVPNYLYDYLFQNYALTLLQNYEKIALTLRQLILRGARQVGKTTAVNIFSKQFDQYVYLDLEKLEEADLFRRGLRVKELLQSIFLFKNITPKKGLWIMRNSSWLVPIHTKQG